MKTQKIFAPSGLPTNFRRPAARAPARLEEVPAFGDNPGALRMFAYTPSTAHEKMPLVVMLHGCGQTAANYEAGSGWTALAHELGFAVLAPEQNWANNMNGCFNWFQAEDNSRGHGEAASIRAMIAWMVLHRRVDPAQIFITGLSAGGGMSAAMLAAYPETFAGGAIIAGLPVGAASNVPEALNLMRHAPERTARRWGDSVRGTSSHNGPWPAISIWYSSADPVVHASNGEASVAQWADAHGLALSEFETEQFENYQRKTWRTRNGKPVLQAFLSGEAGHGVPVGGPAGQRYGAPGAHFFDGKLSSTVHIAAFWGLPITPAKTGAKARSKKADLPGAIGARISAALKIAGLLKA